MKKKLKLSVHTGCFLCNNLKCKGSLYHCSWCFKPTKRKFPPPDYICSVKCQKDKKQKIKNFLVASDEIFKLTKRPRKKTK